MGRSEDNPLVESSKSAVPVNLLPPEPGSISYQGKTKSLDFFCIGCKQQRVVLVDSPG
jgi:hypothetical protein